MSDTDLCRFTVATPTTYADVAVPESARICEIMPRLIEHSGDAALAEEPAVILQRLGEEPFDPDHTVRGSGVREGETLLLRPADEPAPPMLFDDLVDGVGGAVSDGFGRWPKATFHRWLVMMAVAPLLLGLALHLTAPPDPVTAVSAAVLATTLVAASGAMARAVGDRQLALVFGAVGVAYATTAGWIIGLPVDAAGAATSSLSWPPTPEQLLVTGGITVASAGAANWLLGEVWPPMGVTALVGLLGSAAAAILALLPMEVPLLGATIAMVVMLGGPHLPTVAYRLARLAPPDLAQEPADLQSEIVTPLVGNEVLELGRKAEVYLTVLMTSTTVVSAAAMIAASFGSNLIRVVAGLAAVGFLLRSRMLRNMMQRFIAVVAGAVGSLALAVRFIADMDADERIRVGTVLIVIASVVLISACRIVVPRRLSPLWGRAADLAETTIAIAALPLVLWAHGLFSFARGLAG